MYKVSVIIPIYNVESYVQDSLNSALKQTLADIEYILINDCTTDDSMKVVKSVLENHPRKKDVFLFEHERNLGLSAARNTGLQKATADYVFFMDSDDEIAKDCIEKHYYAIKTKQANFTVANINLGEFKSIHIKPISKDIEMHIPLLSFLKREWSVSAWNKMICRNFLISNDLYFKDGLVHEDVLWSYQISCKASRIAVILDATYFYKIREGSITTKKNGPRKLDSLLYILKYMNNDQKNNKIPDDCLSDYYSMFDFWRLNTALLLLRYDGSHEDAESYYLKLKSLKHKGFYNIYSLVFSLPFSIFTHIGKFAYKRYKR